MILCLQCGRQNRQGHRFCTTCGAGLEEGSGQILARLVLLHGDKPMECLLSELPRCFGRDDSNDVVIKDHQVSARHMRLYFDAGAFWVEDLKSLNSTFVNGEPIREPRQLVSGDLIKMGRSIFRFEI